MYLNERTIPPAFIVDAIPGARELADAARAARASSYTAAKARRLAAEAAKALASGHIADPHVEPRPGATRSDLDAALDAYRDAAAAVTAAERAYDRSLVKLHSCVSRGMASEEFQASHEELADKAHAAVVASVKALRKAYDDRNLFDRLINRQRDSRMYGGDDPSYHLSVVERIVTAPVVGERERAIDRVGSDIMTPADRVDALRAAGVVK